MHGKYTEEYCFMEFHENRAHAHTVDTRPFFGGLGTRLDWVAAELCCTLCRSLVIQN